jgi:DNA-binding NarL/FixJ family response regulator
MTTVLIADRHPLFRQGLAALLRMQPGWQVLGESADGERVLELAAVLQPDAALLGAIAAPQGAAATARGIRRVSPRTRIVALPSLHESVPPANADIDAWVPERGGLDELFATIRAVLRDGAGASPLGLRQATAKPWRDAGLEGDALSRREREVLRLLAEGRRTKEVAALLGISPKTVETYRSRLTTKLGVDHLPGLVRCAMRAGLVAPVL